MDEPAIFINEPINGPFELSFRVRGGSAASTNNMGKVVRNDTIDAADPTEYWLTFNPQPKSSNLVQVAEIEFRGTPSGPDLTDSIGYRFDTPDLTSGTPPGNNTGGTTVNSGHEIDKAFDNNTGTYAEWKSAWSGVGFGLVFDSPQNVQELAITCVTAAHAPTSVTLQFIDAAEDANGSGRSNGVGYVKVVDARNLTWTDGETKVFTVEALEEGEMFADPIVADSFFSEVEAGVITLDPTTLPSDGSPDIKYGFYLAQDELRGGEQTVGVFIIKDYDPDLGLVTGAARKADIPVDATYRMSYDGHVLDYYVNELHVGSVINELYNDGDTFWPCFELISNNAEIYDIRWQQGVKGPPQKPPFYDSWGNLRRTFLDPNAFYIQDGFWPISGEVWDSYGPDVRSGFAAAGGYTEDFRTMRWGGRVVDVAGPGNNDVDDSYSIFELDQDGPHFGISQVVFFCDGTMNVYFPNYSITPTAVLTWNRMDEVYLESDGDNVQLVQNGVVVWSDNWPNPDSTLYGYMEMGGHGSGFMNIKAEELTGSGVAGTGTSAPATTLDVQATENIAQFDLTNVYSSGGSPRVRRADASDPTKFANSWATEAITSGSTGTLGLPGSVIPNTGVSTASELFLSDATPGGTVTTAPSTAGHIVQSVGEALNGIGIVFNPGPRVTL